MPRKSFRRTLKIISSDRGFLRLMQVLQTWVAKLLSIAMMAVILVTTVELLVVLSGTLFQDSQVPTKEIMFTIFGWFLNILIALELLENITGYLQNHVVQIELVVVTSLTAVARKIIILDLSKTPGLNVIGLSAAVLALSISYWIVRRTNPKKKD